MTTQLIVLTTFLDQHPDVVKQLLEGDVEANDYVNSKPDESQKIVNDQIKAATGKPLAATVLSAAWKNLTFTTDPISSSLQKSADAAISLGLLDKVSLKGIDSLDLLNEVLVANGKAKVMGV